MNILSVLKKIYLNPRHAFGEEALEDSFEESIVWYLGAMLVTALWFAGIEIGHFPGIKGILNASVGCALDLFELAIATWIIFSILRKRGFPVPVEALISGLVWIAVAWIPLELIAGWILPVFWINLLHVVYVVLLQGFCVHSLTKLSLNGSLKLCLFATLVSFGLGYLAQSAIAFGVARLSS